MRGRQPAPLTVFAGSDVPARRGKKKNSAERAYPMPQGYQTLFCAQNPPPPMAMRVCPAAKRVAGGWPQNFLADSAVHHTNITRNKTHTSVP